MSEQEAPEHWSTERLIAENVDFATREDLDGVDDQTLWNFAALCEVEEADPDACVPCWAYAEYHERQKRRLEEMAPKPPETLTPFDVDNPEDMQRLQEELDALHEEPSSEPNEETGYIPVEMKRRPPVEVLQFQMSLMQQTLEEIVNGPPIPPKDVSIPELALLVLAAERWIRMTEAQGVELSGQPQQVLDSTRELVARLKP